MGQEGLSRSYEGRGRAIGKITNILKTFEAGRLSSKCLPSPILGVYQKGQRSRETLAVVQVSMALRVCRELPA